MHYKNSGAEYTAEYTAFCYYSGFVYCILHYNFRVMLMILTLEGWSVILCQSLQSCDQKNLWELNINPLVFLDTIKVQNPQKLMRWLGLGKVWERGAGGVAYRIMKCLDVPVILTIRK